MSKKLRVAGEVVSHCRKCGLDLNHVIVAMVGPLPKKVKCLTCQTEHVYHRPMEERVREERVSRSSSTSSSTTRSPATSTRSASARALAEMQEENEREKLWQSKIAGKATSAFVAYSPRASFAQGQLVRHVKFGDGYVVRVIDASKIEVLFQDGPRVLAQGIAPA